MFVTALREPLTSGCKCQLSVAREGDLRRIDGDRQASAGRTQSPREKSWKEGDLHIPSHTETSPAALCCSLLERGHLDQQRTQSCHRDRLPGPRRYSSVSENVPQMESVMLVLSGLGPERREGNSCIISSSPGGWGGGGREILLRGSQ